MDWVLKANLPFVLGMVLVGAPGFAFLCRREWLKARDPGDRLRWFVYMCCAAIMSSVAVAGSALDQALFVEGMDRVAYEVGVALGAILLAVSVVWEMTSPAAKE